MNIIIRDKSTKYNIKIKSEKITIKELKIEIEKQFKLNLNKKRLIYNGQTLSDDKTLLFYNIKEDASLVLLNNSPNVKNIIEKGNKEGGKTIDDSINQMPDIYKEINISKELKKYAIFMKILTVKNPQRMKIIINNIKSNNLAVYEQIQINKNEFIKILSSPIIQEEIEIYKNNYLFSKELLGTNLQDQYQYRVILNEKESEMINRLKKLGNFETIEILVAYFYNDKDEEKTANYLLNKK